jgi:hypothetical protein
MRDNSRGGVGSNVRPSLTFRNRFRRPCVVALYYWTPHHHCLIAVTQALPLAVSRWALVVEDCISRLHALRAVLLSIERLSASSSVGSIDSTPTTSPNLTAEAVAALPPPGTKMDFFYPTITMIPWKNDYEENDNDYKPMVV